MIKLDFTAKYIVNFKPIINKTYAKSTINLKNFLIFLLCFNKAVFSNYKINIRKKYINNITYLRAPNKYKKAQVKVNIQRYLVTLNKSENYKLKFNINFYYFINYYFNFINYFESTFFFLDKKIARIQVNDIKSLLKL